MTINHVTPSLDELASEDPVIRILADAVRAGRGKPLDQAVRDVKAAGVPAEKVDEAAEQIRALARLVQTAEEPRAVTEDGLESWYPGSREDDRFWPVLAGRLARDGWSDDALDDLDRSSSKIVAHLADPHGERFDRRGLVLGYVQSGKTTNFTAVAAKAADAGYHLVIVLSGIHDGLRAQTQDRLNEQLRDLNPGFWQLLTDEDDFRAGAFQVEAMLAAHANQKVLAVVKKNAARLRALKKWLKGAHPDTLARTPVLVIDDEADQASINTAKDRDRATRINRLIREVLELLPRSSYVGYTATPFANILIDPTDPQDLYPRHFIVDLPRSAEYVGPETIFGREPLEFDPDGGGAEEGEDMIRPIEDDELGDLKPKGAADRWDFRPHITPSLEVAIQWFLLSTAARRARAIGNKHATMLVHTSQFTVVHSAMRDVIAAFVRRLAERLAHNDGVLLEELEAIWVQETDRVPASDFGLWPVSWDQVRSYLPQVAHDIEVIADNSASDTKLDYPDDGARAVIAVGGNKLSRGLTLEGLSVSFFVRSASAYDTLLQMGRWFGYRHGYADLTRIWLTDEMRGWFHHLATVEQEIRYDIERYERQHVTPLAFAPRIRTHPSLSVTAASKMRDAVRAEMSFSGRRVQTILFNHRDRGWLTNNLEAGRDLVAAARTSSAPVEIRAGVTALRSIPSARILDFLDRYRVHENSKDLQPGLVRRYIEREQAEGRLTHFTVVIFGRPTVDEELGLIELGLDHPLALINRARLNRIGIDYADIKALMSKSDRAVDLEITSADLNEMKADQIAGLRNPAPGGIGDGSGLAALYPVAKNSRPIRSAEKRTRVPLDAVEHVLGLGLVFPTSPTDSGIEYYTADVGAVVEAPAEEDEPQEDDPDAEAA